MPNEWLKKAQQLAEMLRDLRKAEQNVKDQKARIRRFLVLNGCRQSVPWRTARRAKNKRSLAMGLSNKRAFDKPAVQNLQQHEYNGTGDELAIAGNCHRHEHNGYNSNRSTAKILRCNGKQLVERVGFFKRDERTAATSSLQRSADRSIKFHSPRGAETYAK